MTRPCVHAKDGDREGFCIIGYVGADSQDNSQHLFLHVQRRFHNSYQRSIQGLTLGSLCIQWPLWERERGSSHLWPSLTAQDWRGEVAQKAHRRKNKYIQRPLLTARPLPCQPHSQWSESQCAVSLSLRAQMRPSYDGHLHKSPRHPDKQLRLKLEIEFNIHSQQFPKCCLSDLQYAHTRWKWLSYKNILMSHVLSQRQTCGYGGLSASLPCLLRLLLNYHEATCALKRGKYLRKANITLQLLAKTPSIKSLPFLDFIDWLPLTGLVMF